MLSADIKDQFFARMRTHRRKIAIFSLLFVAYSFFGFFALPGIIKSQAQKFVHNELGLALSVDRVEVNPWRLAVRLDNLSIKNPASENATLLSARSIFVNAELWSSLWIRGASIGELDLLSPFISAHILNNGQLNLMKLIPPDDGSPPSDVQWRIGLLGVHQGRIHFQDDTRRTPFSTVFSPLNLSLADLSSRPDKDGGYTLHAETEEGEALDWKGLVALNPVRSEGELKISGLKATTPWRYLQDELPVIVEKGRITLSGQYKVVAGDDVSFTLSKGRLTVDDLALSQRSKQPLALILKQLDIDGISAAWPQTAAGFTTLQLNDFSFIDKTTKKQTLNFNKLLLKEGRYQSDSQLAELKSATLEMLKLQDGKSEAALFQLPVIALEAIHIAQAKKEAHIGKITLEKGVVNAQRSKEGKIDWEDYLSHFTQQLEAFSPPEATAVVKTASKTTEPEKSWTPSLGELDLIGFTINFTDHIPSSSPKVAIENINLRLFPQQPGETQHRVDSTMSIASGGTIALKGGFQESPLTANLNLNIQALKLPAFAPWAENMANFALEKGSVDIDGKLNFQQAKTTKTDFAGNIIMHDFAANDLEQDERFLAWKKLAITGINWQLAPEKLYVRSIQADKPFIRAIIGENKSLNLSQIVVTDPVDSTTPATVSQASAKTTPYPLKIDRIHLTDGSMLFADLSLRPQFATGIQSLQGDIHNLSSQVGSKATIALKGRVDEYGKADINGTLNPLAGDLFTDISVKFSNVELTTLTPYSSKFAGYQIDKGKLSLDLNYKINQRKLDATNKVVLDQLTLGEKVKSPDATSLPLKLALAILKDKNGVIDLDVPITGSLDDPKFKVGPLIWKAIVNVLTKAATAPFSMIAGLVGGGDNMDSLVFPAGSAVLATTETNKLDSLAKALNQRTALRVEVRGAFDADADTQAIRLQKFDQTYQKRLAEVGNSRKALEELFKTKLGSEALAQQRALNLKPASDKATNNTELQLAISSYENSLRHELAARETVLDGDLRQLALDRARFVRNRLVETNGIDDSRVFVMEPVSVKAVDNTVVMKITLTAN